MKQIRKGAEPAELATWRATIRPTGSIPPWRDLSDPPSSAMRDQLSHEQRQICCYCTGTIAHGNFHIEHFCPRDADRRLTYTWSNLLASCQGGGADLIDNRRHCGAAKDNWFDPAITVNPLTSGVEALFRFPLNGRIYPNKSLDAVKYAAVDTTISNLHLNAPSLVERRSELLTKAAQDAVALDRNAWRDRYLAEHDSQLQEFWPALNYNYHKLWSARFAASMPAAGP